MQAIVYEINTTSGKRYGYKNAKTGAITANGAARWKTAAGAIKAARKNGHEI